MSVGNVAKRPTLKHRNDDYFKNPTDFGNEKMKVLQFKHANLHHWQFSYMIYQKILY